MTVLLSWLREFVECADAPADLARRLSLAGVAVDRVESVGSDTRFDLDITSNRPDLLSHYGVAREIAALSGQLLPALAAAPLALGAGIPVIIQDPAACGRYCAAVLDQVRVAGSPAGIASRLEALGQRPINNIADLTNYTLWEMGHPTHAFDLDKLRGQTLVVRRAKAGEKLITLDGVERTLTSDDLVIADAERPVALAGVMGGLETAISAATRRVVIESAWFDPLMVRRTARRHKLHTDASHRFERGADPEAAPLAARLIAARAQAYGAHLAGGLTDVAGVLPAPATIPLRPVAVARTLGAAVAPDTCAAILANLGCSPAAGSTWRAPSWRADLAREIDLIEEIARIHGYEQLPSRLPDFSGAAHPLPEAALHDAVRQQLRGRGFAEAVTVSFASEAECRAFAPATLPVRVQNPLSEEAAILRTATQPGMLRLLQFNLRHGAERAKLFEIGKIYWIEGREPRERAVLSLGTVDATLDDRGFKGEVEAVLAACSPLPLAEVATFGPVSSATAAAWKLPRHTWLAEIALDRLFAAGPRPVRYQPPPRFPASVRDFSFLLADGVTWAQVRAALSSPAIPLLVNIVPVEVFRGASVPAGTYSLLIRATLQSPERTLHESEIQPAAAAIVGRLLALGGEQR